MPKITKELSVDVIRPNSSEMLVAKQGDSNSRFLKVKIMDDGKEHPVSGTSKVTINVERPDKESFSVFGVVNDDGTVTVPINSDMLKVDGILKCDISIINTENDSRLTSTKFYISVEEASNLGDISESDPDACVLVQLIGEVEKLKDQCGVASYELIDTIELTEDTTLNIKIDPVKSLYLKLVSTAASQPTSIFKFYYDNTQVGQCYSSGFTSTTGTRYWVAEVAPQGGWWRSTYSAWSTNNSNLDAKANSDDVNYYLDKDTTTYPVINKITTSKAIAAGTTIEIWGIKKGEIGSGIAGADGATFIPSVSEDGTLSWTNNGFLDNPEEVNLMGLPGKDGAQGEDGYTPQKGVDYWTDEDKNEIKSDVNVIVSEELAAHMQIKPEFANSVDECTDTHLLYVLPDNFIYAYMKKYIMQKTNEYSADTAKLNTRLNSSGVEGDYYGVLTLPMIDVALENPYTVNITGCTLQLTCGSYWAACYYDSEGAFLGRVVFDNAAEFAKFEDGNYSFNLYNESWANAAKVRIMLGVGGGGSTNSEEFAITTDDVKNLFVEFVPKTINDEIEDWYNTGNAFVPADYEDRIVSLEEEVEDLKSSKSVYAIPEYWQEAADEAVAKVKAIQDDGGKDILNFVWFSDMHHNKGNQYTKNIGKLCAYVMDSCNIPLCLMSGDTMSAESVADESTLLEWLEDANEVLTPIGKDRLLRIKGNHDDVYGYHGETAYVNKVAPAKIYNRIFRSQAEDFRRVFGGDGSYFYIDTPQKIRIVCLNAHYYDGAAIANGETGASSFGLGSEQLGWLSSVALISQTDIQGIIIALHVPPTENEINTRTDYLSLLGEDGENLRNELSASSTPVKAIFCGHAHVDANVMYMGIPIITITCANNTPYDGTAGERVSGTTTETAIDIVSFNTQTGVVKTTRLGWGADREVS